MTGWIIALGVLIALAMLPLGVSVKYDGDGPMVKILAGSIRYTLFPAKKKLPGQEKTSKKSKENPEGSPEKSEKTDQKKNNASSQAKEQTGGSLLDFLPLVELGLDFLGDFRRKLRVNDLKLHLTMAADDPCDLAVNYGRANAAMAALLAHLNRLFVIKRQDVRVNCDFTAEETTIAARLDLTITLGRVLALAAGYGVRGLKTYLNIQKKRKGGAEL